MTDSPAPAETPFDRPVPREDQPFFNLGWVAHAIEMALGLDPRVTDIQLVSVDFGDDEGTKIYGFKVGGTNMSLTLNITP